jgi:hypothetical protein
MEGLDRTLRIAAEKLRRLPAFEGTAMVTDDPILAAQTSSLFQRPSHYFVVLDGPRMGRSDAQSEVVRRRNALAKSRARQILLGSLSETALQAIKCAGGPYIQANDLEQVVSTLRGTVKRPKKSLHWGPTNLGVGLYLARLGSKELVCDLAESPSIESVSVGRHLLVACERGDELAEVIASNLAYGFSASFATFPEIAEKEREDWIEDIYAVGEKGNAHPDFESISLRAKGHLVSLDVGRYATVLWVTAGFPWGIAIPTKPSSHFRRYPDFGRMIVEGLWSSAPSVGGRTALLIDPGTVSGSEIPNVNRALLANGCLTHVMRDKGASVAEVGSVIDLLPHDIIVLSSHAGDASGERLTYEYEDYEGRRRQLIVDEAVGIGYDQSEGKFQVTTFNRFHSIDGVDWRDKSAKEALPVGSAVLAWSDKATTKESRDFIVDRKPIPRVIGSMGIQLNDGTWFFVSQGFSPASAPLIVNNSCWSWHEISERTMYAGARGYLGCLVPVLGAEVEKVSEGIFGRYLGLPLPIAMWAAQRDAYQNSRRCPYVLVGLPCIHIPQNESDSASFYEQAIIDGIVYWTKASNSTLGGEGAKRSADFLSRKLEEFRRNLVRRPIPKDRKPYT